MVCLTAITPSALPGAKARYLGIHVPAYSHHHVLFQNGFSGLIGSATTEPTGDIVGISAFATQFSPLRRADAGTSCSCPSIDNLKARADIIYPRVHLHCQPRRQIMVAISIRESCSTGLVTTKTR
jgi:hypothetical protein